MYISINYEETGFIKVHIFAVVNVVNTAPDFRFSTCPGW